MAAPEEKDSYPHRPVLYQEIILSLRPFSPGLYLDGTVGAGGHAWGILQASQPNGRLLGLDVDPQALAAARERLAGFGERAALVQSSYTDLSNQLSRVGWPAVDGILLDLGVSSMQIDTPERGFSFQADGPLDMRFDPRQDQSAADLVNHLAERELSDLIWRYGEELGSRKIARAIVRARPLYTTRQLADVILKAARPASRQSSRQRGKIHPATRTFQALRIAVNQELQALEKVLPAAVNALVSGGRLAVIAFHSLEDRLVKQFAQLESRDCICPPHQPVCTCGHKAAIKIITRHPIEASEAEKKENSRSRSAKLRVVEKL